MTPALLLLLAVQGGGPTVGDTVWVSREVAIPPGRTVRPAEWEPEDPVELLGPPRVLVRGGSAEIVYPIVIWHAGEHTLRPPGPLFLGPDGTVDSLAPEPVSIRVASVLPAVPPDTGLRPQPRAEFVARGATTPIPLLILLGITGLLLAPLHWWWRRRGRPTTTAPAATGGPRLPIDRWSDAGESRAVAAAAAGRLRGLLAARIPSAHPGLDTESAIAEVRGARPDWPVDELGELLRALDRVRFGQAAGPDALALARRAGQLEPRLQPEVAA